jgi:serine/threonine protein kinase
MTETGLSLGTPHYMSPEQASADRDLSARSDVYSLGCVLYEMLAGQPPHTGPSAQSILVRILTEDPRELIDLRRTVPPNVAATVMKSIEKLPADRFDSAKEFRLGQGVHGRPRRRDLHACRRAHDAEDDGRPGDRTAGRTDFLAGRRAL